MQDRNSFQVMGYLLNNKNDFWFILEKTNVQVVTHQGIHQSFPLLNAVNDVKLRSEFKDILRIPRRLDFDEWLKI